MTTANDQNKGIPIDVKEHISYADNSIVSKILLEKDTGSITLFSFDKGQGLTEHTSPFDAVVHIIDGSSQVTVGGEIKKVSTGHMIIMPANIPHALKAEEPFKMVLIMIRSKT